jgi:pimeloyl-ACP methyl ester carboxylesterase
VRVRFSEAGDGPALFLLHDFLQTRATFDAVRMALARRHRVITPDFPGFGESEKPDPTRYAYGYLELASVVADLVSALGVGRAHVCGVGLGASVALTVAGEHKDLTDRLVLAGPIVYEHVPSAFERLLSAPLLGGFVFKQLLNKNLFSYHFQRSVYGGAGHRRRGVRRDDASDGPTSATDATPRGIASPARERPKDRARKEPAPTSKTGDAADARNTGDAGDGGDAADETIETARSEALFRYYDSFNSPAARQAAHATLRATHDKRPLVATVPRIVAPTLVICGRDDPRVPVEHGRRLTREIAGARLEVLECGHAAPEEAPAAFVDVVSAFLGKKK